MDKFEVEITEHGKIVDFLDGVLLDATREEFVRQQYLRILHYEYGYAKELLAREIPIYYGSSEMRDREGRPVRADIVVYRNARARRERNQGAIVFLVECKAPHIEAGYNQLVSYIYNTSAEGGVWYNGSAPQYYRRLAEPNNDLIDWTGIPRRGVLGCIRPTQEG